MNQNSIKTKGHVFINVICFTGLYLFAIFALSNVSAQKEAKENPMKQCKNINNHYRGMQTHQV